MNGTVGVLNVGAGDTKLSFDPSNPAERVRAARIVRDMLRRGYALLVEVEREGKKEFERALDFKEETCEYVIADFDSAVARVADHREADAIGAVNEKPLPASENTTPTPAAAASVKRATRRAPRSTTVSADSTRAVSVSRSAGG